MKQNKTIICLFTLIIILSTAIIAQQIQLHQLNTQVKRLNELQQWLFDNYGVTSIEELKTKLTQEIEGRYRGNPFVTSLWQGQLQAENLTFMHGYWYNPSSGQLENKTDIWAFPEQTATFIIFKDSAGNVCAKNTTSGQIQFGGSWDAGGVNGADAATVMQATINALTNGGKIYISSSSSAYVINSQIEVNQSNIIIVGAGIKTVLQAKANLDSTILHVTKGGVIIADLKIDGNKANQASGYGIVLNGTEAVDCLIDYVYVYQIKRDAIRLENGASGNTIARIYSFQNSGRAIRLTGAGTDFNVIIAPRLDADLIGITIDNGANRTEIIGGYVTGMTQYGVQIAGEAVSIIGMFINDCGRHGIQVSDTSDVVIIGNKIRNVGTSSAGTYNGINLGNALDCIVVGNRIWDDQASKTTNYAIAEGGTSDRNEIAHNIVRDCLKTILITGSNSKVHDNIGFVTSNSGTATVANGEYILHGIDSSFNIGQSNSTVLVTPYTTTYDGVPVVVGCPFVNGTHIQVSAYWVNGTAISDDAIQIWWQVKYTG